MLSITQFEVYVLDHGRWTIHARYGSDQRKAAVMDARSTEFTTGLPTKVIVETYFPEIDESELVTAYISPKARELREAAKVRRSGRNPMTARHAAVVPTTRQGRMGLRPGFNLRQYLMQGFVAGALSLVAATVSTVIFSWCLKRAVEAGLPVSASLSTTILTYAYAVFFLFYFMSMFRSKLPLHRLLSYLWAKPSATTDSEEETTKSIAAAIAPKLRPKRPAAAVEAEAARAQEELKVLRGDPQPEPEPEILAAPPPSAPEPVAAPAAASVELTPQVEVLSDREKKKREKKRKEAEEKAVAQKAAAQKAAKQADAAAIAEPPPPDPLPLERAVLRRFVTEVLQPATAGTMPNDPVTRRGVSLIIAGAAAALAETARTSYEKRLQLIEDALTFFGINAASAVTFVLQHDELVGAPANAALVNLGRSALAKHLEGADVARILAVALAGWRTPHGQPTGPAPVAEIPVAAPAAPEFAPHDIYVLTELRMGPAFTLTPDGVSDAAADAGRDAAMGLHNSIVRSVLGTHAGHEVKHTGTGIFAQFKDASIALGAAIEIQRRFTATYGPKLAIAAIASTGVDDDPLLTPNLVRQAQTAAAQACDGEILAERRVQRAVDPETEARETAGEDDDAALVKIPTGPDIEEPALYEHMPVNELAATPQVVNAR